MLLPLFSFKLHGSKASHVDSNRSQGARPSVTASSPPPPPLPPGPTKTQQLAVGKAAAVCFGPDFFKYPEAGNLYCNSWLWLRKEGASKKFKKPCSMVAPLDRVCYQLNLIMNSDGARCYRGLLKLIRLFRIELQNTEEKKHFALSKTKTKNKCELSQ